MVSAPGARSVRGGRNRRHRGRLEEGSALVTSETRGSGCVLLVSEAAGAICRHMEDALVHPVGDIDALAQHLTLLYEDRGFLERLRAASLRGVCEITWRAAGLRMLSVYRDVIEAKAAKSGTKSNHESYKHN